MKTPTWEPSEGSLVAWLNANRQALPVDLWTITLLGGAVLRYSGGDAPVTVAGHTWALGPGLRRGQRRQSIGVSVDTLSMTVLADDSVLVGTVPILQALAKGVFAGATVALQRAFLDAGGVCRGVVPDFFGRMGAIKTGRSQATAEVRSHAELLDVMVPGDVYQPGCRNTLYDPQCGLAASAYTVTGAASTAGDPTRRIVSSVSAAVLSKPAAWADLGVLTFTSGPNTGVSRTVRTHALAAGTATIVAVYPFPFAIAGGDAFTLRAGCNKAKDGDCTVKFSNVARFRAEPYVPAPETIT